jgi:hypothetical protein
MKRHSINRGGFLKWTGAVLGLGAILAQPLVLLGADHSAAQTKTITGEVVDLMCYLDHGARGEGHKGCAQKCIENGGPVGLLSHDQLYLVIGDHKPINDQLASKAAQTVTLKGKVVERNGMKMIEHAELQP